MFKNLLVAVMLTLIFVFAMNAKADARPFGNGEVIGGRPAGCPARYCGCGLRKYLGIVDKSLDLAWNWARKFPHTVPSPGAVAVRLHHVMQLVSHVAGTRWVVRDYNGGRHLAWIHERDVNGYVFVSVGGTHESKIALGDGLQAIPQKNNFRKSHARRIRTANSTRTRRWHQAINVGEVGNSW